MLSKKSVVISGAGKGFGFAIAKEFYNKGSTLALITRSAEDINKLEQEFPGKNNIFFQGDVSNECIVDEFFGEINSLIGSPDILINNAGIRFRKFFLETQLSDARKVMDQNFFSMFLMTKKFVELAKASKARSIVNISSIAGRNGVSELSNYVASKAAIIGWSKSLALELAEKNIRVNSISAGFCETSYFNAFKKNFELYQETIQKTPLNRWGTPEELAKLCIFLGSDESSFITGEDIAMDGGWSAA